MFSANTYKIISVNRWSNNILLLTITEKGTNQEFTLESKFKCLLSKEMYSITPSIQFTYYELHMDSLKYIKVVLKNNKTKQ